MNANFDLRVRADGASANYAIEVLASPAGENAAHQPPPQIPPDLLSGWQAGTLSNDEAQTLGKQLYEWLFPTAIQERLIASMSQLQPTNTTLRLRLRIDPPELSRLPWELCWTTQDEFLSLIPDLAWVRYIAEPFAAGDLLTPKPLKLVIALASPAELPALNTDGEAALIIESLKNSNDEIQWEIIPHTTWERLQDALAEGVDVLHYVGHGGINENGEGYLALEDDEGSLHRVTAKDLRVLFRGRDVRLVVLNACQSAVAQGREAIMAVAPSLVRSGIPAVIAQQAPVPDSIGRTFAKTLYDYLVKGNSIDSAVTNMRIRAYGKANGNAHWGIPVLFMRAPDGNLWQNPKATTATTTEENSTGKKGGAIFNGISNSQISIGDSVVGGDYIEGSSPRDDDLRHQGMAEG